MLAAEVNNIQLKARNKTIERTQLTNLRHSVFWRFELPPRDELPVELKYSTAEQFYLSGGKCLSKWTSVGGTVLQNMEAHSDGRTNTIISQLTDGTVSVLTNIHLILFTAHFSNCSDYFLHLGIVMAFLSSPDRMTYCTLPETKMYLTFNHISWSALKYEALGTIFFALIFNS